MDYDGVGKLVMKSVIVKSRRMVWCLLIVSMVSDRMV